MTITDVNTEFKKYEAYKDSGVEWLGEIPEGWQLEKGKWLFKKEERPVRKNDEIVTCFRDGQVTLRKNRRLDGFTNALKEHGYQGIRKGDLVIHAMDAFGGSIGVSDSDGKSTPVYAACTSRIANSVNQYYYAYFLRNLALSGFIETLAKGIRERSTDFRYNDFGKLLLPVPPIEEQTAIANFLDNKTTKIDTAISQKEKMIELLKERKQIIIQNVVTGKVVWSNKEKKFIPLALSEVEGKDSGVEWIGEIPERWKPIKFKFIIRTKARLGWKGLKADEYIDDSPFKFLSTPNIKNNEIDFDKAYHITEIRYYESPEIMLEVGDVLLVKDGSTLGISNIVRYLPTKCTVNSSIAVLKIMYERLLNPLYLNFFLKSSTMQELIELKKDGMGVPHLFQSDINNFRILLPPIEEQKQIVTYIETQSSKIEKAITLQQTQIERLKEYKATLIDSAVTGKIKVSNYDCK